MTRIHLSPHLLSLVAALTFGLVLGVSSNSTAAPSPPLPETGFGISAGIAGHSGLAYRHTMGATSVQVNGVAVMLDQGNYFAGLIGVDVARRLSVWRGRRDQLLVPSSLALRAVAGVSGLWVKDVPVEDRDDPSTTPIQPNGQNNGIKQATSNDVKTDPWGHLYTVSAGFGVEIGRINRGGLSFYLDVRPTWAISEDGFWGFIVLPYSGLLFSW